MSRGSTTCTSTTYDLAVSKPFSGFECFRHIPHALPAGVSSGLERQHQRQQLFELDDHLLADIGVSHQQAVEEACWIRVSMGRICR